jgi:hypothetical protein
MYASFLKLRLDPKRIDQAKRVWREQVFPSVGAIAGLEGTFFALDDASGEAVSAGFWPDEQAARTFESSGKLRQAFKPLEPFYVGAPARVVYPILTSEGISVGGEAPEATAHPGEHGAPAH